MILRWIFLLGGRCTSSCLPFHKRSTSLGVDLILLWWIVPNRFSSLNLSSFFSLLGLMNWNSEVEDQHLSFWPYHGSHEIVSLTHSLTTTHFPYPIIKSAILFRLDWKRIGFLMKFSEHFELPRFSNSFAWWLMANSVSW